MKLHMNCKALNMMPSQMQETNLHSGLRKSMVCPLVWRLLHALAGMCQQSQRVPTEDVIYVNGGLLSGAIVILWLAEQCAATVNQQHETLVAL